MGWFSRKPSQEQSVSALTTTTLRFYRASVDSNPSIFGLVFRRPHGRYIHLLGCLTAAHVGLAPKFGNADAVLNEVTQLIVAMALSDEGRKTFDPPKLPQDAVSVMSKFLPDFLNRWSAWIDIKAGANPQAGTSVIASILHDSQTTGPMVAVDAQRLRTMAEWFEETVQKLRTSDKLP
jgi:hypothetical protein